MKRKYRKEKEKNKTKQEAGYISIYKKRWQHRNQPGRDGEKKTRRTTSGKRGSRGVRRRPMTSLAIHVATFFRRASVRATGRSLSRGPSRSSPPPSIFLILIPGMRTTTEKTELSFPPHRDSDLAHRRCQPRRARSPMPGWLRPLFPFGRLSLPLPAGCPPHPLCRLISSFASSRNPWLSAVIFGTLFSARFCFYLFYKETFKRKMLKRY